MLRYFVFFVLAAGLGLAGGCTGESHVIGQDDSGATRGDGGAGEPCGAVTCESGTVCCNASCGICAAPDEACIAIACADAGTEPADGGTGEGEPCGPVTCAPGTECCNESCGYCVEPGGSCTEEACEPEPQYCGTRGAGPCPDDHYCDYPDDAMCGATDIGGICKPRPEGCTADCPGVCGCDGETYCNACNAAAEGVDVAHDGACDSEPGPCEAMNAGGRGACELFLGYTWNGSDCVGVSGCECVGTDCDDLFDSQRECLEAFDGCATDCRTTGCDDGEYCTLCWADYACIPEGAVC